MPVYIEWHREQLWHHRVVGDQGGQGGVLLQETLVGIKKYFKHFDIYLAFSRISTSA